MTRAPVRPELIAWARERAGVRDPSDLQGRFPHLAAWEAGEAQPTLKQLEAFAQAVHVPIGYLFLPEPPQEKLPIPDFRTHDGRGVRRASPDLLDMLYACQERQGWYREFAQTVRMPEVGFVGSASLDDRPKDVAARMAQVLGFDLAARAACRTWEEALRQFIAQADAAGVLVMVSGVVLSNNRRTLDPEEFRGFALADARAPWCSSTAPTRSPDRCSRWRMNSRISGSAPRPCRTPAPPPSTVIAARRSGATRWRPSFWCRWTLSGR